MKYSIIYSSQTGNTKLLAETINDHFEGELEYIGPIQDVKSETLFIGFWTDKGNCSDEMATYLKSLHNKKIFLFGTCGFGESDQYFERILENVKSHINDSNTIIGSFMCQGKMPIAVRNRYESMMISDPERFTPMIHNFDKASTHPDQNDFNHLIEKIKENNI